MTFGIGNGKYRFSASGARYAVAGYAFGTHIIEPDRTIRDVFEPELAPQWGYRTCGCIPATAGNEFSNLDILVAAGLNGELDVSPAGALQIAARPAAPWLAETVGAGGQSWLCPGWRQALPGPEAGGAPRAAGAVPRNAASSRVVTA